MGRPINKKYFGNTNLPGTAMPTQGTTGIGGEGVATIALGTVGASYSQGLTASVSVPSIKGGVRALVSPVVSTSTGEITGYTVTRAGTGYTSAPSITLSTATAVSSIAVTNSTGTVELSTTATVTGVIVGMAVTGSGVSTGTTVVSVATAGNTSTIVMSAVSMASVAAAAFYDAGLGGVAGTVARTSSRANAINFIAWTPLTTAGAVNTSGSGVAGGDINKQSASIRYQVITSQGYGQCKLVTGTPTIGTMNIIATDSAGNTYYVKKLTARKAILVQQTGSNFQFVSNQAVGWTFGAAVPARLVTITNA